MLKLVQVHKLNLHSAISGEAETNPSHQFIDELMAQVRYAHLDEVWEARLMELTDKSCSTRTSESHRKYLKIL